VAPSGITLMKSVVKIGQLVHKIEVEHALLQTAECYHSVHLEALLKKGRRNENVEFLCYFSVAILSCVLPNFDLLEGFYENVTKPYPLTRHLYALLVSCHRSLITHGAEPFLRSRQLCSHSGTSQHFMEPEGSLPCSLVPILSQIDPVHTTLSYLSL
jgi:hypothetical protein